MTWVFPISLPHRLLNIGFNLSEGILNETADSMFSLFITTSVNGKLSMCDRYCVSRIV